MNPDVALGTALLAWAWYFVLAVTCVVTLVVAIERWRETRRTRRDLTALLRGVRDRLIRKT